MRYWVSTSPVFITANAQSKRMSTEIAATHWAQKVSPRPAGIVVLRLRIKIMSLALNGCSHPGCTRCEEELPPFSWSYCLGLWHKPVVVVAYPLSVEGGRTSPWPISRFWARYRPRIHRWFPENVRRGCDVSRMRKRWQFFGMRINQAGRVWARLMASRGDESVLDCCTTWGLCNGILPE